MRISARTGTLMVLGIAAVIGSVGRHLGAFGSGLERAGDVALHCHSRRDGRARCVAHGFLFGLGFETSSRIAAYVMVAAGGPGSALLIGAAFSSASSSTLAAGAVAVFQTLQLAGISLAVPELSVSAAIVAALIAVYAFVLRVRVDVVADAE